MIAMPFGNSVATEVAVAIVFHSGYGHTQRQAEAVRRGIEKFPGASVLFLTSEEAQTRWEALERADAISFFPTASLAKTFRVPAPCSNSVLRFPVLPSRLHPIRIAATVQN